MAISIDSFPQKAREQVARKMLQSMKNAPPAAGKNKYGNQKAVRQIGEHEVVFDSQKEARRFDELLLRLRAGQIRDLKLQPEFTLREAYTTPEGFRIRAIRYRADFSYEERVPGLGGGEDSWKKVVEDVKSEATRTRVYEMKKKLLIERHGIYIREI